MCTILHTVACKLVQSKHFTDTTDTQYMSSAEHECVVRGDVQVAHIHRTTHNVAGVAWSPAQCPGPQTAVSFPSSLRSWAWDGRGWTCRRQSDHTPQSAARWPAGTSVTRHKWWMYNGVMSQRVMPQYTYVHMYIHKKLIHWTFM